MAKSWGDADVNAESAHGLRCFECCGRGWVSLWNGPTLPEDVWHELCSRCAGTGVER